MAQALATASAMLMALSAHSVSQAANLFEELDAPTLQIAREAVQSALETRMKHEPEYWSVPGVAQGVVIPRRTWKSATGHWCREFEENIQMTDGRTGALVAVRCRSRDGRWRLTGG